MINKVVSVITIERTLIKVKIYQVFNDSILKEDYNNY